jgi:putative ABC transport system permease protein
MIRVTLRGLVARPLRTALTALAIVVGVAFVCAASTLTDTLRAAADSLSSAAYDGTDAVVTGRTAFKLDTESSPQRPTVPAALLGTVRSTPGVSVAAGDVTDQAMIVGKDGKPIGTGPYFGAGFDSRTPGADRLTPYRLRVGHWATAPGQVVIDQLTAEKHGYGIGASVPVTTRGAVRRFRVVGVATFANVKSLGSGTLAVFELRAAQSLFGKSGRYDRILAAGSGAPAALRSAIAGRVGADAQVVTARTDDRFDLHGLSRVVGILRTILLAFAGVAVVVGGFTIFNTLSITVAQRTREFGLLRMVGAERAQLRRAVLVEGLVLGIGASLAGLAGGIALAKGLGALFEAMGMGLPSVGTVFGSQTVIVSLLVGVLVTLAAALVPALRATRIAPVAAIRGGGEGTGTVGGWAGILSRAVRALASLVGRPAERLGGSAGRLARRNAMRNPGRTAGTALALVIGVMLVTAVTVVAGGLRSESVGALEQRVQATSVITGADGWSPIDPKIARIAAAAPGVHGVSSIRQDAGLAFGKRQAVNAVDPATITKLFAYDYKSGTAADVAGLGRTGALVDEGWAADHRLEVGDRFTLTAPRGEKLTLQVRAIEHSAVLDPLSLGPITISDAAFAGAWETQRNRFTLVDGGGQALERAMAAFPDAKIDTKAGFVHDQTKFIGSILGILWVLLALAVIVSLFGIVNTLVLSTFERMRELGTLRAVGMSRRQVRRMVRHESVITALIGTIIGIVAGLGLAAVGVAMLGKYGIAYTVPAGSLAAVAVVAIVAGVLAAVLPARRASRIDVLSALAYE